MTRHGTNHGIQIALSRGGQTAICIRNAFAWPLGVILAERFRLTLIVPSPDQLGEQDVLVSGFVFGATPYPATITKRL